MRRDSNGFDNDSYTLDAEWFRKMYTTRRWLTRYALACGYIERVNGLTMWCEHGIYHVRWRGIWDSYASVRTARASFTQLIQGAV